jgi:phosphatidate cytidylyltransferase
MLLQRVLTASVLLPLVLLALFKLPNPAFAWVSLLVPVLAGWEWLGLFKATRPQKIVYCISLAAIGACFIQTYTHIWPLAIILFGLANLFWIVLLPFWLGCRWQIRHLLPAAALGLVLLMAAWMALVLWHAQGAWSLLGLMLIVWIADTAAYFSGKAFGKHKLAPQISPGKSWEGVLGAVVAVNLYVLLLPDTRQFLSEQPI